MSPRSIALLGGTALAGVLALTILGGSYYTVDQGEVGVVLRNGAVIGTSDPGFHFKTPWIEDVKYIETRQQRWTSPNDAQTGKGSMEAYSKDLQPAYLRITINYSVVGTHAADLYARYGTDFKDNIIIPAVYNGVKIAFGQYDAASAISQRGKMVQDMLEKVQASITSPDVHIDAFQLEDISFSSQFMEAVNLRQRMEIEVQQQQQTLAKEKVQADIVRTQAGASADAVRAAARAEADSLTYNADAQAHKILVIGQSTADALKLKGEALRNNPGLVQQTIAEHWLGGVPSWTGVGTAIPLVNLAPPTSVTNAQ